MKRKVRLARVLVVRQGWVGLDPRVGREMETLRLQGHTGKFIAPPWQL